MGTLLYAKGVFLNRCFDELNLTQPSLVTQVHEAYVHAGADVLETNTFGANRVKLGTFGLGDETHAINVAGVGLARRAAGDNVFVAGAIGHSACASSPGVALASMRPSSANGPWPSKRTASICSSSKPSDPANSWPL